MIGRTSVLVMVLTGSHTLLAQAPVTASARQDLDFGVVLPGLAVTVSRLDPVNSGQYELRGTKGAEVQIDFQLPTALVASDGTTLPLVVSAGDGGYAQQPALRAQQAFDPNAPLITSFGPSGRLYLWLGGTALSAPTQPAGDYSATITLTVAYTGT